MALMAQKTIILLIMLCLLGTIAAAQDSTSAVGGNITEVNIVDKTQTDKWQGFVGRITFVGPDSPANISANGGNINRTNFNFTSACAVPASVSGTILLSNSSTAPAGLVAGNLSKLDDFITNASPENASNTFPTTSTFTVLGGSIPGVPTAHTYVNSTAQSSVFREGYFNDAAGNIVFAIDVDLDTTGYNTSSFDFQILAATHNRTTTPYYITSDLTITCPSAPTPPGGGRGGRGYYCVREWDCAPWELCTDGVQTRTCTIRQTLSCRDPAVQPPLERTCSPGVEKPQTIEESDIIQNLKQLEPLRVTTQHTIPAFIGELFEAPITLYNPNPVSIEWMTTILSGPTRFYALESLHRAPILYHFGLIPLHPTNHEQGFLGLEEQYRIGPQEEKTILVKQHAPLAKPQTIPATFTTYAGETRIGQTETTIDLNAKPFSVQTRQDGHNTEVTIIIDNRGNEARTAYVQLDFNNGITTQSTDVYSLDLPVNDVGIYAYAYRINFPYDHIIARYKNKKLEVR